MSLTYISICAYFCRHVGQILVTPEVAQGSSHTKMKHPDLFDLLPSGAWRGKDSYEGKEVISYYEN